MLGFSFGELAVVALIAILVLRPEDIPGAAAQVAKWVKQLRELVDGFVTEAKSIAREAAKESGVDEVVSATRMIRGDDGSLYKAYDTSDLVAAPKENDSTKP